MHYQVSIAGKRIADILPGMDVVPDSNLLFEDFFSGESECILTSSSLTSVQSAVGICCGVAFTVRDQCNGRVDHNSPFFACFNLQLPNCILGQLIIRLIISAFFRVLFNQSTSGTRICRRLSNKRATSRCITRQVSISFAVAWRSQRGTKRSLKVCQASALREIEERPFLPQAMA